MASCDCPMAEPFQSKQVSYATVKIPCSESPWPEYIWVLLWNLQLSPSMAMVSGAENFNCKFRIKMYEVQLLWLITSAMSQLRSNRVSKATEYWQFFVRLKLWGRKRKYCINPTHSVPLLNVQYTMLLVCIHIIMIFIYIYIYSY